MRLCKIFRHLTNLFDGWRAHAEQVCLTKYAAHLEGGCSYVPVNAVIQCILDLPIVEPFSLLKIHCKHI